MASKASLGSQRLGEPLIAAAYAHAVQVGERLADKLALTVEEGETLPDFTTLQLQLGRYLELLLAAVVAADEAHLAELDDDQDPRLRRDEAAEALYRKLIELRLALNGFFGAERTSALLGLEGDTPRDPLLLHRVATRALERLREPAPELPRQLLRGIQIDRNEVAEELQPETDELGQALDDVARENREADRSLERKTAALTAFETAVRGIGRILSGAYEVAELPNFADKVRLTLPSRGRRGSEGGEEPPAPEEPPVPEESLPPGDLEPPPQPEPETETETGQETARSGALGEPPKAEEVRRPA